MSTLYEDLSELQVRRVFFMRRVIMMDNALTALVFRALDGYEAEDEKARNKLWHRAEALVARLLAGRAVAEADAAVAATLAADVAVLAEGRAPLMAQREAIEKRMRAMATGLAVHPWQKSVRGFGALGLATIVAEAGDLAGYATPDRLWRRLGLAPFKGRAGCTWRGIKKEDGGLSAKEWEDFGYAPQRLGRIHGDVTIPLMQMGTGTVYRAVYDHAKAAFAPRAASPKHAHMHALRVMTKELLRDLWRVWHGRPPRRRQCAAGVETDVPPALAAE